MMNALNRSTQLFTKLMFVNGSVLFSMSLQRLVLFLIVVRHWLFGADGLTIAMSFINGARFDLCVLGFINIPLLFIVWGLSTDYMNNTSNKFLQWIRRWIVWIYVAVTTLAIHLLGLFDLMFFAANSHRWTYYDWQESGFGFISKVVTAWGGLFTFGVIMLFIMLWLFRSIFTLYKVRMNEIDLAKLKYASSMGALVATGVLIPLFITALAARGTWTAHHINIEHAQVSQIQALNQMTLSPVWAFDKKF